MKKTIRTLTVILQSAILIVLISCNEQTDSPVDDEIKPKNNKEPATQHELPLDHNSANTQYLFYHGLGVYAFDSENPFTPTTIQDNSRAGGREIIETGIYDPSTQSVSHIQPYRLLWLGDGDTSNAFRFEGQLYHSLTTPPFTREKFLPVTVTFNHPINKRSSDFCSSKIIIDWKTPDFSQYFFRTKGSDLNCSISSQDDNEYMVTLNMAADAKPITVPSSYSGPLRDADTGAISGWLVNRNGSLYKSGINFESLQKVTGIENSATLLTTAKEKNNYILISQTAGQLNLLKYDANINNVSNILFSIDNESGNTIYLARYARDDENFYFVIQSGDSATFYRMPLSASLVEQISELANETNGRLGGFSLSKLSIFYQWQDKQNNRLELKYLAKSDVANGVGRLISEPNLTTRTDSNAAPAYFRNSKDENGILYASILGEDGGYIAIHQHSQWIASLFNHERKIYSPQFPNYKLMASGISKTGRFGNTSVSVFDTSEFHKSKVLGMFDDDIYGVNRVTRLGNDILMEVFSDENHTQTDIIYLDISKEYSLIRINITADISETIF